MNEISALCSFSYATKSTPFKFSWGSAYMGFTCKVNLGFSPHIPCRGLKYLWEKHPKQKYVPEKTSFLYSLSSAIRHCHNQLWEIRITSGVKCMANWNGRLWVASFCSYLGSLGRQTHTLGLLLPVLSVLGAVGLPTDAHLQQTSNSSP